MGGVVGRCNYRCDFHTFCMFLQYRLSSVSYEISLYVWLTIWAVLCNVCFFHIFRTYVGVIRFSSFVDIYRVFWSLTISYVVLFWGISVGLFWGLKKLCRTAFCLWHICLLSL